MVGRRKSCRLRAILLLPEQSDGVTSTIKEIDEVRRMRGEDELSPAPRPVEEFQQRSDLPRKETILGLLYAYQVKRSSLFLVRDPFCVKVEYLDHHVDEVFVTEAVVCVWKPKSLFAITQNVVHASILATHDRCWVESRLNF